MTNQQRLDIRAIASEIYDNYHNDVEGYESGSEAVEMLHNLIYDATFKPHLDNRIAMLKQTHEVA